MQHKLKTTGLYKSGGQDRTTERVPTKKPAKTTVEYYSIYYSRVIIQLYCTLAAEQRLTINYCANGINSVRKVFIFVAYSFVTKLLFLLNVSISQSQLLQLKMTALAGQTFGEKSDIVWLVSR